jgi:hypothetical protein
MARAEVRQDYMIKLDSFGFVNSAHAPQSSLGRSLVTQYSFTQAVFWIRGSLRPEAAQNPKTIRMAYCQPLGWMSRNVIDHAKCGRKIRRGVQRPQLLNKEFEFFPA